MPRTLSRSSLISRSIDSTGELSSVVSSRAATWLRRDWFITNSPTRLTRRSSFSEGTRIVESAATGLRATGFASEGVAAGAGAGTTGDFAGIGAISGVAFEGCVAQETGVEGTFAAGNDTGVIESVLPSST